jgi:hypothetical protein
MLDFRKTDTSLLVKGDTFPIKDALKIIGKWDPSTRSWVVPAYLDSEPLRKDLESKLKEAKKKEKDENAAKKAHAMTPEGRAEAAEEERKRILACLEEKKATGAYHWICCEKCNVIDWKRQFTSCMDCATWDGQSWNTFCVRGRRYTGD